MENIKSYSSKLIRTKSLVIIFLSLLVLVIISIAVELKQTEKETFNLMINHSNSIIGTIKQSAENAIVSNRKVEYEIREGLLKNAGYIRLLYNNGKISNKLLEEISVNNNISSINIVDKAGRFLFSYYKNDNIQLDKDNILEILSPVFNDEADTLIIGLKNTRFSNGNSFIAAVSATNNSGILITVDAEQHLKFRKEMGLGILIKEAVNNEGIIYAAIQNRSGIIAASGNVSILEPVENSKFLTNSFNEAKYHWRITEFEDEEIFEAVSTVSTEDLKVGLLRIGLSMKSLEEARNRIFWRSILMGAGIIIFGLVIFSAIIMRLNYEILQKNFSAIESFSSKVLENVADAILVTDLQNRITSSNKAANALFGKKVNQANSGLSDLFGDETAGEINNTDWKIKNIACTINNEAKNFLITKSQFRDKTQELKKVIVIKDFTELKKLEENVQRNARLSAMGELASAVAHEIRNPLNSISTIIQLLIKDFQPADNENEFNDLTKIVYNEVGRINKTIVNFLQFATPEKLSPAEFPLSSLLKQLKIQFTKLLSEKNISLEIDNNTDTVVIWDNDKILQVLINLIQNAAEAIKENGRVKISVEVLSENIEIKITDSGPGIPPNVLPKIFNLYFTTKTTGSGIGLSLVQKIIENHGGIINVQNIASGGAEFTINLPIKAKAEYK
ncbi:MAG: PAS domain-containing protein [Ignavibacteria bacterium]|nr:PAS domain-containing protein [Ignavibacteria bacterium]